MESGRQPVPAGVGQRHGLAVLGAVQRQRPVARSARAIGLRVTSWSQAATYHAFSGWPMTLWVVELAVCTAAVTVDSFR